MTAKQNNSSEGHRTGTDSTAHNRSEDTGRTMEDKAQAMQADAKRKAETVKENVKEGIDRVVSDDVQQKIGGATQDIRQEIRTMSEDMRSQAADMAESRKSEAAQRLDGVASAIRKAGHGFEERDEATLAHYTNSLAEQIDSFSHNLREREIGALVDDARQLAHRQPEMVVTGALALGFLVGRFLKSSTSDNQSGYRGSRYGEPGYSRGWDEGEGQYRNRYRDSYNSIREGYAGSYQGGNYRSGGAYDPSDRYAGVNTPYRTTPDAPSGNQAYGSTYNNPQQFSGGQYTGQRPYSEAGSQSGSSQSTVQSQQTNAQSHNRSSAQTQQGQNTKANSESQHSQPQQSKGSTSAKNPKGQTGGSRTQE